MSVYRRTARFLRLHCRSNALRKPFHFSDIYAAAAAAAAGGLNLLVVLLLISHPCPWYCGGDCCCCCCYAVVMTRCLEQVAQRWVTASRKAQLTQQRYCCTEKAGRGEVYLAIAKQVCLTFSFEFPFTVSVPLPVNACAPYVCDICIIHTCQPYVWGGRDMKIQGWRE